MPGKKKKQKSVQSQKGLWLARLLILDGSERDEVIENIGLLVSSGITVSDAVHAISKERHSWGMRRILARILESVESGSPLWSALKEVRIFRVHTISLVRIGEESGKLSENLQLIAQQEAKDRTFRSNIRSAMLYPSFVLALTGVIGIGIAWFILPRLASVFEQLQLDLPLVTRWLIAIGDFFGAYGAVALPPIIFGLIVLTYLVFFFPKTRFIGQALLFLLPGVRRLMREVELTRFGYLLGTLLKASVPINVALASLERATIFHVYRNFYRFIRLRVDDGYSFQKSVAAYKRSKGLMPPAVQQLIFAGEQSGSLPESLLRMSERFESRTADTTKNLTVILEPMLLVIVWLGVLAVALAVILPIYNLVGTLDTATNQPVVVPAVSEEIGTETESNIISGDALQPIGVERVPFLEILESGIGFVNVREEPTVQSPILGTLQTAQRVEFVDVEEGWYLVVLSNEEEGWVLGDYVEVLFSDE